ncbi:AAA family ATPase [Spirillospora sp. NPDC047279]|uniref:ATP-binding protein n=1 Tax=Spirillospora sp. NPDC047279 TaxID=3155478 RepID=UPI0033EE1251
MRWVTVGEGWRAGSLPVETTRLVGRREELARLERLLCGRSRLVTVTGVAGVGKTRLAQRAAVELAPRFADGAWWVALSPLTKAASLPYAIFEALPLADQTTRSVIDVVADYLADRDVLLVLDTCEHLAEACAMTVQAVLAAAPKLRVLATSRRALNVAGEQVLPIAPLPVPDTAPTPEADIAALSPAAIRARAPKDVGAPGNGDDAVALLAERAAVVVPGFMVTGDNRADSVRLCQRLDGLPLAIELAAARLAAMSPTELTARLEERFEVGDIEHEGTEADPPWHRALRTAIGWSHQLCTPAERLLWARVSVFAGSFGAGTAGQVCADGLLPADQILDLLDALAGKSILTVVAMPGGAQRYRMLDTIRAYGTFWLRNLNEHDRFRRRHLDFYLTMARRIGAAWLGPDQYTWYDWATAEHANLRTALEFTLTETKPETGDHSALELAGSLWFYWYGCGFPKEGQHYLERALAHDPEPGPARTKTLWASSIVFMIQGNPAATAARAAECAAAAEGIGDADAAEMAQAASAGAATISGGEQAQTVAAPAAEELLAGRRADELTLATLLAWAIRGVTYVLAGSFQDAVTVLEQMRLECDRHGERWYRAYGDSIRAQAELACGRPEAARFYAQASLEVKHRLNDVTGMSMAIDQLAQTAAATGQKERAARLLGLAQQLWSRSGRPQAGLPEWVAARQACEKQTREALGDHTYEHTYQNGHDTDPDTTIADILSIPAAPESASHDDT